jgi:hypothetical protein
MANSKDKNLFKEIELGLQSYADEIFNPSPYLNKEDWVTLQRNEVYLKDLEKIRLKFNVPQKLLKEKDIMPIVIFIGDSEICEAESDWVSSLEIDTRKAFRKAIEGILLKYGLRPNFYDFVQSHILYKEISKGLPLYNFEMFLNILHDPKIATRYNLSAQEKKFTRELFKSKRGITTKNIPKEHRGDFKKLNLFLSKSKNSRRKSRNLEIIEKILSLKDEEIIVDETADKQIKKKRNYLDVVAEMDQDFSSPKDDIKKSAKYRKQISRFKNKIKKQKKDKN